MGDEQSGRIAGPVPGDTAGLEHRIPPRAKALVNEAWVIIITCMTRRMGVGLCILVVLVAGTVLWRATRPDEPSYGGKPLTRWLESHVPNSSANPPFNSPGWKKADEALRHIGTNAIPTLLRMVRAKDPPKVILKLIDAAQQRGLAKQRYRRASQRNEEAEYAFEVLGTNAVGAVPELIAIYQADVSPSSQRCAALALGHIGRPAAAAIPVLLNNFTHTNGDVRFYAVSALNHIGGEPSVVVPALKGVLRDPKLEVRWNASGALSKFGRRAQSAVPELLEAINDPATQGYKGLKEQLETALWRIAPEKVGKPIVVEDNTPMVMDGATTAAVDVVFNGERRTLIRPGRTIPCLAQFWDSEPRGPLSLFRTRSGATAAEHSLGQFEVLGLPPPPTNLNVSVLCVISDRQIILCARDNHTEEFLEIRRLK